jgi:GNAT superfamily N-acetyltransferase
MIIRCMKIEDIPELAVLYKQFWNENSCIDKMRDQYVKLQGKDTHILLSAIEQNRLVGSVMGIICEELYGDCRPFLVIENMVVDKSNRKKGIGKALIYELQRLAKDRDCTQMILVTETNRLDACHFYESVGFHPSENKGYKKKL